MWGALTVLGVVGEFGGASNVTWLRQNVASSIDVTVLAKGLPPSELPPDAIARNLEQSKLAIASCNKTRLFRLYECSDMFYKLKSICSNINYKWSLK